MRQALAIAGIFGLYAVFNLPLAAQEISKANVPDTSAGLTSSVAEPMREKKLVFAPGDVRTVTVENLSRIAIGNPEVVDVSVISGNDLLVKALDTGFTNLIIWEGSSQREIPIEVVDNRPLEISKEVKDFVTQQAYDKVSVDLRQGKVYLHGEVANEMRFTRLDQYAAMFPDTVVNLTTIGEDPALLRPDPLIKLAVQVVEVRRDKLDQLGVSWNQSLSVTEQVMAPASISDTLLRIGETVSRNNLTVALNALIQDNKARLLSEPKLVTTEGKQASTHVGVEVPVLETAQIGAQAGTTTISIEYKEVGVMLTMTPYVKEIDGEKAILTELEAEVSSIDTSVGLTVPVSGQSILVPGFKVRRTQTEVTTVSGNTIVIVGLLEVEDNDSKAAVPGFSKVPVFGRLFEDPVLETSKRELVIMITPELIEVQTNLARARQEAFEQAAAKVAKGRENQAEEEMMAKKKQDPLLTYSQNIQKAIADNLLYPEEALPLDQAHMVRLRIHLSKEGGLVEPASVALSSGVEMLDELALEVAKKQSPYPPFPSEIEDPDLMLEVPVVFHP